MPKSLEVNTNIHKKFQIVGFINRKQKQNQVAMIRVPKFKAVEVA